MCIYKDNIGMQKNKYTCVNMCIYKVYRYVHMLNYMCVCRYNYICIHIHMYTIHR